jgi:hypothetical protein
MSNEFETGDIVIFRLSSGRYIQATVVEPDEVMWLPHLKSSNTVALRDECGNKLLRSVDGVINLTR